MFITAVIHNSNATRLRNMGRRNVILGVLFYVHPITTKNLRERERKDCFGQRGEGTKIEEKLGLKIIFVLRI